MHCDLTSNKVFNAVYKIIVIKRHNKENPCYLRSLCAHSTIYVWTVLFLCTMLFICLYFVLFMPQIGNFLTCMYVFCVLIWCVLTLYIQYRMAKDKIAKAKTFRICFVHEGWGWLCIVYFVYKVILKEFWISAARTRHNNVELICFYLGCGDARMWNLSEKLAKNALFIHCLSLLALLYFILFFAFINVIVRIIKGNFTGYLYKIGSIDK